MDEPRVARSRANLPRRYSGDQRGLRPHSSRLDRELEQVRLEQEEMELFALELRAGGLAAKQERLTRDSDYEYRLRAVMDENEREDLLWREQLQRKQLLHGFRVRLARDWLGVAARAIGVATGVVLLIICIRTGSYPKLPPL